MNFYKYAKTYCTGKPEFLEISRPSSLQTALSSYCRKSCSN